MSLTKSLYREEEVIAALKWCLIRGRNTEAVFWAQECLDSGLEREYLQALIWVWLFTCGTASIGWLAHLNSCLQNYGNCSQESYMNLMMSLAHHVKNRGDNSVLVLLAAGLKPYTAEPNTCTVTELPESIPNTPINRALFQGKTELAWSLLRPQWDRNAWSSLEAVLKIKQPHILNLFNSLRNSPLTMHVAWIQEWTWCIRALATLIVCKREPIMLVPENIDYSNITGVRHEFIDLPMRYRRIFEIPYECLYFFTKRGSLRINETTESDLIYKLEEKIVDSKFWSSLPIGPYSDDILREEFYAHYFPTDIPDEWSSQDRQKSHGTGVIPVGDSIDMTIVFNRCLVRWFGLLPCRSIWNGWAGTLEVFMNLWATNHPKSIESGIHEAYMQDGVTETWIQQMANWSLESKTVEFMVY